MALLSLEIRNSILCLLETGKSQREVARIVKVSQSSVNYVFKKFIETGEIKERPKTGRPTKGSMKDRRLLCRILTKNPNLKVKEVYEESNLDLYISI